MEIKELQNKAAWSRAQAIELLKSAKKGHIGGSLSCADILTVLYYGRVLDISPLNWNSGERDRFILSKGHAMMTLYPILADQGFFSFEKLKAYGQDGTILGGHPDHKIPGVEISTGSLGHGLCVGAGFALGAKLNGEKYLTFVLLGDGECNEGTIWEAALFSSARELGNLVAIIDNNKVGATERTENYSGGREMSKKWEAFGWETAVVDGHDITSLLTVFGSARERNSARPLAVVAETVKGKGVSFMENDYHWHHGIPTAELFEKAARDLDSKT